MEITPEIRQAVAEDECRRTGHDVDAVVTMGSADPVAVLCARCGRSWPVVAETGSAADSNAESNAVDG